MIKWTRTSRLSIKISLCCGFRFAIDLVFDFLDTHDAHLDGVGLGGVYALGLRLWGVGCRVEAVRCKVEGSGGYGRPGSRFS